ncbi:MAG: hypothetical protein ABJB17_12105 [Burkholderiales bacterium]
MNTSEPLGQLASLLVLATLCMSDMTALRLRLLAIGSNLAFIGYGALAGIRPVLLRLLLLVNLLRLSQSSTMAPQATVKARWVDANARFPGRPLLPTLASRAEITERASQFPLKRKPP